MSSQTDRIKGNLNSAAGKAKQVVGRAMNDKKTKSKGKAQESKGRGQKMKGKIKESIHEGAHALAGAIEKVGRRIQK